MKTKKKNELVGAINKGKASKIKKLITKKIATKAIKKLKDKKREIAKSMFSSLKKKVAKK